MKTHGKQEWRFAAAAYWGVVEAVELWVADVESAVEVAYAIAVVAVECRAGVEPPVGGQG